MVEFTTVVRFGLALLALLTASGVSLISYRAYTRSNARTYWYAFIGFACLTTSVAIEAFITGVVELPTVLLRSGKMLELLLLVFGFLAIYVSLDRPTVAR